MTVPLPRFERLDSEKRARLLEAAVAEFVAKGYEAASLNGILAAAGLGKSSYYYYFADKEDLLATVLEAALAQLEAEAPLPSFEGLEATTFWPALETYAGRAVEAMVRHPELVALSRPLRNLWLAPPPRMKSLVDKVRSAYRVGIAAGQSLGCIRTDLDAEWLISLVEAADSALDEHLLAQPEVTPEQVRAHTRLAFDTMRRLLEPAPVFRT